MTWSLIFLSELLCWLYPRSFNERNPKKKKYSLTRFITHLFDLVSFRRTFADNSDALNTAVRVYRDAHMRVYPVLDILKVEIVLGMRSKLGSWQDTGPGLLVDIGDDLSYDIS